MSLPRFFITTRRYTVRLLSHPLLPWFIAIAAMLITLSSLKAGIYSDDEIREAMLTPRNALKDMGLFPADSHFFKNAVMTLYTWSVKKNVHKSLGMSYPWWGDKDLAINFWRPLSSATLWLDYKLWPKKPALMHLESILWFALAAFFVSFWYRRLVGGWAAGVAAILFVTNLEFPAVVAWIAARYAIMTLAFGISAILCHHAWRASGSKIAAAASWVFLVLSLLSGEGGVAAAGYILAYGLFYEKSNIWSRLRSIIPAALIVLIWQVSYKILGYGVHYCSLYVDPRAEPLRYLESLIKNGPILLLNITGQLRTCKFMIMSPRLQNMIWIGAMAQWIMALVLLWPMLRNDRRAAFFLAGALLSLIPACSSASVNERSLFFIGLGGMGMAALAIEASASGASWLAGRRVRRVLLATGAISLVALHAANLLWVHIRSHGGNQSYPPPSGVCAPSIDINNSAYGAGKNIVIVNTGEDCGSVAYTFPHRAYRGIGLPLSIGQLAGTYHDIRITRTDSSTLFFDTPGGTLYPLSQLPEKDVRSWPRIDPYYLEAFLITAFRIRERPMHAGDSVDCWWFSAIVKEVDARGVPSKAFIKFNRPLEDQCFAWVQWDWSKGVYNYFIPPAIGQTVIVPGRFSAMKM